MWTCPLCHQTFKKENQVHVCNDSNLSDFLAGKSPLTVSLFNDFSNAWNKIGKVTVHPTKSMIAFSATKRIAFVIQLGKNFIDVVLPFDKPYPDNLCFRKIAQVPGTTQYNHHLRLTSSEDINEEVLKFMKMAYGNGSK